ncbi:MAG: hypothetical protein OEW77_10695, partial [Gemmatimonadota bacterium]|nr:hypothetical protein [Gemmatimonadota bacterium]
EARREAPLRAEAEEPGEATTWSSERGTEKESDDERRRKRRPRRRRAKPEAIAARLKGGAAGAEADGETDAAEGAESSESDGDDASE